MRFLQHNPLFPKDRSGVVRNERVAILLKQCAYAGYVEAPSWGVPRREGHHAPLVSRETFQRIHDRLNGGTYAPRRTNLNEDFPLRGYVMCDDCGGPLTANWSKGERGYHAYYLCRGRGCASHGKSIRRDTIEGEFEELLQSLQPSATLFKFACRMFGKLWDRQTAQGEEHRKALTAKLVKIEKQVGQILERILDLSVPSVIAAYEDKVRKLEEEKLLIQDRIATSTRPASSLDVTLRTALGFLASPWNLWASGRLEERRAVLKLAFADRLRYARNEGFRTVDLSLPFKILGVLGSRENKMARLNGETSNQISKVFEELAGWNQILRYTSLQRYAPSP